MIMLNTVLVAPSLITHFPSVQSLPLFYFCPQEFNLISGFSTNNKVLMGCCTFPIRFSFP